MYRHVCVHVHIDAWVQTARNAASFFRVLVFFSKDVFKQHGILPFFSPSTNLEYHSRVGLLIVWFLIVCVYVYTFLHAFISECLWCRPNTLQNSTECCLFFSPSACGLFQGSFQTARNAAHFYPSRTARNAAHFSPSTNPSRVRLPSANPEY